MDTAVVASPPAEPVPINSGRRRRPSQAEAEAALQTLIEWAGDDPDREGPAGTPERVVRAYEEFFAEYNEDPVALLARTFEETADYDEMIVLRDIRLESHCEHHMVPILGKAQIADTIQEVPKPRGAAVVIQAAHQCMTTRGTRKPGVGMATSRRLGSFRDDPATRREFLAMIGSPRSAPHES